MKKTYAFLIVASIAGQLGAARTEYELMVTGLYYSQRSTDQSWLALEKKGNEYQLVKFSGSGYPIVLLKNPDALRPGPVKGAQWKSNQLVPGKTVRVSFESKEYRLVASGKDSGKQGCNRYSAYQLNVESEGLRHSLFTSEVYSDVLPWLAWSGDLDKDRRADFLVEYPDDCNLRQTRILYLSSLSTEKQIVAEGARSVASGD